MKNIVILGANEGIGYWMAKQLLEDGNLVGVLDICTDQLDYLLFSTLNDTPFFTLNGGVLA